MPKFWSNGLAFECHECGHCCTFPGGAVYTSETEFRTIANFLEIPFDQFLSDYTFNSDSYISLKSSPEGPCIFYNKGCSIYSVRPTQCRTYPFWPELLKAKTRWDNESVECKGIGQGRTWSKEEIKQELLENKQDLLKAKS